MSLMPSQDSIAEFKMLTSNYPPDYGISSGATISLSLKSGTRSSTARHRNSTATPTTMPTDYFNKFNGANNPRPVLHYNIFGFNVGGPVYIPNVYNTNREKTFFFCERRVAQDSTRAFGEQPEHLRHHRTIQRHQ